MFCFRNDKEIQVAEIFKCFEVFLQLKIGFYLFKKSLYLLIIQIAQIGIAAVLLSVKAHQSVAGGFFVRHPEFHRSVFAKRTDAQQQQLFDVRSVQIEKEKGILIGFI